MNAFPPEDIQGFLQLCAGEWLTLQSLIEPEGQAAHTSAPESTENVEQEWHASRKGELTVVFIPASQGEDCGELKITLPDQVSTLTLRFLWDGTLWINNSPGLWFLGTDRSLALEVRETTRIVKERIWFSKPNLRLRCTLEEFINGQPGRVSFSSEIRRLNRST